MQANSINERKGQQACAECLGIVGAVDPARVSLAMQPPAKLTQTQHVLLTTLLTEHLVRILRVASSLQVLDAASVAIQVCSSCLFVFQGCRSVTQENFGNHMRFSWPASFHARVVAALSEGVTVTLTVLQPSQCIV